MPPVLGSRAVIGRLAWYAIHEIVITPMLSWLEYTAWMRKIAVAVCERCDMVALDCSLLNQDQALDDRVTGPIMDPSKWPPELANHDQ